MLEPSQTSTSAPVQTGAGSAACEMNPVGGRADRRQVLASGSYAMGAPVADSRITSLPVHTVPTRPPPMDWSGGGSGSARQRPVAGL